MLHPFHTHHNMEKSSRCLAIPSSPAVLYICEGVRHDSLVHYSMLHQLIMQKISNAGESSKTNGLSQIISPTTSKDGQIHLNLVAI